MSDTTDACRMPTVDECQSIAEVYRLLARLWLREVDAVTLTVLQQPSAATLFPAAKELHGEEDLERLAADYCQLLIGPRDHLPPFQSVWERGELQSDVTESIKSFSEVMQYQCDCSPNAMLDHIGIQLDIMGAVYRSVGIQVAASDAFGLGQHFFSRHLSWPTALLRAVREKAVTPFYSELANATGEFLHSEARIWMRE